MDPELKSYLLQIIKNQSRIISQIEKIDISVSQEPDEVTKEQIKEIYEQIADSKFKVFLAERELLEAKIKNEIF